ncbi:MAG: hypothetical protein HY601_03925 [Candidatus Omnitrophica bacterium]|nr:hypothetical protein [Candidatus Omnitrophota bacterium]
MRERWNLVAAEFAHHLPYTIISTLIAMAGVWAFGTQLLAAGRAEQLLEQGRASFHLFHPLHICLSAIATTSLFWRYRHSAVQAAWVGAWGTVLPCGLSDYVFPYIGGRLLGEPMELHMCLVQEPQLFFSFLGLGILGGFWAEKRLRGSHLFSHGAHVFVSSGASLLYLISFGFTSWMSDVQAIFPVFAIIVLAVWVPCCISDIVVPVATAHKGHAHAC